MFNAYYICEGFHGLLENNNEEIKEFGRNLYQFIICKFKRAQNEKKIIMIYLIPS